MRGDTRALPFAGTVRRHEWEPKIVRGEPRQNTPRLIRSSQPVTLRAVSQTRVKIMEALKECPAGITCHGICCAKRLGKKAVEQMLNKMLAAGLLTVSHYQMGAQGRQRRVYRLAK